jgi:lipoprotein-anchoring transpeptidase ErfK/SrfK
MLVLDGHSSQDLRRGEPKTRSRTLVGTLALRASLGASLLLAAGTGALLATQLRPAKQVASLTIGRTHIATSIATPPVPLRAVLAPENGPSTASGAWLQTNNITLRVTLPAAAGSSMVRAEAELLPALIPFTGTPNAFGQLYKVPTGGSVRTAMLVSNLVDGQRYHWRVRTYSTSGGASAWHGGGIFGVAVTGPQPPKLAVTNMHVGGWSALARPLFRWTDAGSSAPVAYHEYRIISATPTGTSATAQWKQLSGQVLELPVWPDGSWRAEVRAVDQAGNRSAPADWSFGLSRHAPAAPTLLSETPAAGAISNVSAPTASLMASAPLAPVAYYEYAVAVDAAPGVRSLHWTKLPGASLSLPGLADAHWQILIRAVDAAGNTSAPARWSFTLDREHPLLTGPTLSAKSFTQVVEAEHVRFGVGKPSTVSFAVFADGASRPLVVRSLGQRNPGVIRGVVWDGKLDNKRYAPVGSYHIVIDAADNAGNQSETRTPSFSILNKRIYISISKEALWAYEGKKLVTYALVTNGGADTPTIPGIFHVQAKVRNFVFHSPWPKGSPLYYAPSPTNFAVLYNADGGYFLHDAPWRWNFGPGSNSVAGSPGGNYTGTHGCTNVPYNVMAQIYDWADVGTLIQIVQ